jgi:hypothetical protein
VERLSSNLVVHSKPWRRVGQSKTAQTQKDVAVLCSQSVVAVGN